MWNPLRRKSAEKADEAEEIEVTKQGWLRRSARGTFRFARFISPPNPIKRQHAHSLKLAIEAFKTDRPACPDCRQNGRSGVLLPVADDPMTRRCSDPECGTTVTLNMLAQANSPILHYAPAKRRDYFLRQAMIMFIIACALVSAAAIYSAYRGSVAMFVGGLVLSAPLFMTVFAMRYRAWQADTGRFYEVAAPLGDFVRDEMRAVFSSNDRQ